MSELTQESQDQSQTIREQRLGPMYKSTELKPPTNNIDKN